MCLEEVDCGRDHRPEAESGCHIKWGEKQLLLALSTQKDEVQAGKVDLHDDGQQGGVLDAVDFLVDEERAH